MLTFTDEWLLVRAGKTGPVTAKLTSGSCAAGRSRRRSFEPILAETHPVTRPSSACKEAIAWKTVTSCSFCLIVMLPSDNLSEHQRGPTHHRR